MNINILLLKQIAIISAICGAVLGLVSIIPYINIFSFTILMLFLSAGVLIYMKQKNLIGIFDLREGSIFGAVIGFVSFIAFAVVFIPLDIFLGLLTKGIHALISFIPVHTSFLLYFFNNFGGIVVLVMLTIFVGLLSALMNAFTALITAYFYEALSGIKKESNNENIDIEIK
ncbi:hypothetical protein IJ818_03905 [bacterium]|nr:hypothetical protein [bacterium]